MCPFRFLDHTADVGVEATGPSMAVAFAEAARGVFSWIADLDTVRERGTLLVRAVAGDPELLLAAFLNELNYQWETARFLFRRVEVLAITRGGLPVGQVDAGEGGQAPGEGAEGGQDAECQLRAVGYGEPFEPARHHIMGQVKAVTYHGLSVERDAQGWRVQVLLDI